MMDKRESAGATPGAAAGVSSGHGASSADRAFLLECRLEQLGSALTEARAEADRARARLAEAAAREADTVRREALMLDELAAARSEVVGLHRRLEHSEALRAELEGHLFEAGALDDAADLVRLRREVVAAQARGAALDGALGHLRSRVEELVASRDTLLARFAEWQHALAKGDTDAVDLAEFIAGLRGEILELEQWNMEVERREADLRDRLGLAEGGAARARAPSARERVAPDEDPVESVPSLGVDEPNTESDEAEAPTLAAPRAADPRVAALAAAEGKDAQIALLLRLGRGGDPEALPAIRRSAASTEPLVRAAAYEALGRLLQKDPSRLEPLLMRGLADPDPRVRRRVVLSAAMARGLALVPLLDPHRADPDAQVRRVVARVLRGLPSPESGTGADVAPESVAVGTTSSTPGASRRRRR